MGLRREMSFTLIELLIVISVIAILASLLLPALGKVRKKGNEIACLNNLRQIGIVFPLYAGDYQDYLIPALPYGLDTAVPRTFHLVTILNYIRVSQNAVKSHRHPLMCPARRGDGLYVYDQPDFRLWYQSGGTSSIHYSYGFNIFVASSETYNSVTNGKVLQSKLGSFRFPSSTLNSADAYQSSIMPNTQAFRVSHDRNFNTLWLDGHTERMKTSFPEFTDIGKLTGTLKYYFQNSKADEKPWLRPYSYIPN